MLPSVLSLAVNNILCFFPLLSVYVWQAEHNRATVHVKMISVFISFFMPGIEIGMGCALF